MLRFRLQMEFDPVECDEAVAVLRSLAGPVRAEPGCRSTRFVREVGDGCALSWVEEWRSIGDFERHLQTLAFRRILAVIEMAAAPPTVEIDDVASRRGFDLIEEILGLAPEGRASHQSG